MLTIVVMIRCIGTGMRTWYEWGWELYFVIIVCVVNVLSALNGSLIASCGIWCSSGFWSASSVLQLTYLLAMQRQKEHLNSQLDHLLQSMWQICLSVARRSARKSVFSHRCQRYLIRSNDSVAYNTCCSCFRLYCCYCILLVVWKPSIHGAKPRLPYTIINSCWRSCDLVVEALRVCHRLGLPQPFEKPLLFRADWIILHCDSSNS